ESLGSQFVERGKNPGGVSSLSRGHHEYESGARKTVFVFFLQGPHHLREKSGLFLIETGGPIEVKEARDLGAGPNPSQGHAERNRLAKAPYMGDLVLFPLQEWMIRPP